MKAAGNNKLRVGIVGGLVAGMVGLAASPAFAIYAEAYHGNDRAIASGHIISVSDKECDNNRVYAEYNTVDGNYGSFSDPDGCNGDSGLENSWDGSAVRNVRVCEVSKGCSAWKPRA